MVVAGEKIMSCRTGLLRGWRPLRGGYTDRGRMCVGGLPMVGLEIFARENAQASGLRILGKEMLRLLLRGCRLAGGVRCRAG
jgi:hypothetical protein